MSLTIIESFVWVNMVKGKVGLIIETDNFLTTYPNAALSWIEAVDMLAAGDTFTITVNGTAYVFTATPTPALSSDVYDDTFAGTQQEYVAHLHQVISTHPVLCHYTTALLNNIAAPQFIIVHPNEFDYTIATSKSTAVTFNITNLSKVDPVAREDYHLEVELMVPDADAVSFRRKIVLEARPVLNMLDYAYTHAVGYVFPGYDSKDPRVEFDIAPALRSMVKFEPPVFNTNLFYKRNFFTHEFCAVLREKYLSGGSIITALEIGTGKLWFTNAGSDYQHLSPDFPQDFNYGTGYGADYSLPAVVGTKATEPKIIHKDDLELLTWFYPFQNGGATVTSLKLVLTFTYWNGASYVDEIVEIPATNSQPVGYEAGTATSDEFEFPDCLQFVIGLDFLKAFLDNQAPNWTTAAFFTAWFTTDTDEPATFSSALQYYEIKHYRSPETRHFYFVDAFGYWQHVAIEGSFTQQNEQDRTEVMREQIGLNDPTLGQFHSTNHQFRRSYKVKSAAYPKYYRAFLEGFLNAEHVLLYENGTSKKVGFEQKKITHPPEDDNMYMLDFEFSYSNLEHSVTNRESYL